MGVSDAGAFLRLTRVLIATIVMAIVVRSLELALHLSDKDALAVLLPSGIATYLMMCWLLNVAKGRDRLNRGLLIVRNACWRAEPAIRPGQSFTLRNQNEPTNGSGPRSARIGNARLNCAEPRCMR